MAALNSFTQSNADPTRFQWTGTFTDTIRLALPVPRDIRHVSVTEITATPQADHFTAVNVLGRPKEDQVDLYSFVAVGAPGVATVVTVMAWTD